MPFIYSKKKKNQSKMLKNVDKNTMATDKRTSAWRYLLLWSWCVYRDDTSWYFEQVTSLRCRFSQYIKSIIFSNQSFGHSLRRQSENADHVSLETLNISVSSQRQGNWMRMSPGCHFHPQLLFFSYLKVSIIWSHNVCKVVQNMERFHFKLDA